MINIGYAFKSPPILSILHSFFYFRLIIYKKIKNVIIYFDSNYYFCANENNVSNVLIKCVILMRVKIIQLNNSEQYNSDTLKRTELYSVKYFLMCQVVPSEN